MSSKRLVGGSWQLPLPLLLMTRDVEAWRELRKSELKRAGAKADVQCYKRGRLSRSKANAH
eukprot:1055420-Pelagomonas_calceolata.AAC.1